MFSNPHPMNRPSLLARWAGLAAALVIVLSGAAIGTDAAEPPVQEVVGAAQLSHAHELSKMGRRIEAEKELAEVVAQRVKALGADHPATLRAEALWWDVRLRMRETEIIPA